jgi:hypothetical protein
MSSFDRIVAMIYEKNRPTYPLVQGVVTIGEQVVEGASTHNTRAVMRAVHGRGYTGQVDLFYTRVNLTALGDLIFVREEQFSYDELLGLINYQKDAQMTADDFTNDGLPLVDNGVITNFILSAKSSSLVWLGNTQVTLLNGIPAEAPGLLDFWNNEAADLFT